MGRGGAFSKLLVFRLAVALSLASALATPARAEHGDQARAEELIRQANDLRRQGDNVSALRLLVEAYETARTPRTAAQLALSELTLGYWLAAHDHLTEALTSVSHHPWIDANRKILEGQLAKADSHIAEIVVEGKPEGAEVLLNGKAFGKLPLTGAIRVSEGRVDLEARAQGYEPQSRSMTITGRSRERVVVGLVPIPSAVPNGSAVAVDRQLPGPVSPAAALAREGAKGSNRQAAVPELAVWRRILPWTLLGLGGAVASVGVWQYVEWRAAQADFEAVQGCGADSPKRGTDSSCEGLYDKLSTPRTRTFVAYGAAAVLGGAAAALFVINRRTNDVTPGVAVGPGTFYASCRVSF